jgi:hypothetical protein
MSANVVKGEGGFLFASLGPNHCAGKCPHCGRVTTTFSTRPGSLLICPCSAFTHVPDLAAAEPVAPVRHRNTKRNSRRAKARVTRGKSRRIVRLPHRHAKKPKSNRKVK